MVFSVPQRLFFTLLTCILVSASPSSGIAATEDPLFTDPSVLKMTLRLDLRDFRANKDNYREDGVSGTVELANGTVLPAEFLSRGHGSFSNEQPPFKISISKKARPGTPFEGHGKIKVYTSNENEGESRKDMNRQVLSNFLIHKLYERFGPFHYRTRLLKTTFVDTNVANPVPTYTTYSFLLEPNDSVEKRLGLTRIEDDELLTLRDIPYPHQDTGLIHAFEFLIGNPDYNVPGQYSHMVGDVQIAKNSRVFRRSGRSHLAFIFDWDMSYFVHSPHFCRYSGGFFIFDGDTAMPAICDWEKVRDTLHRDLARFRYRDDVMKHRGRFTTETRNWLVRHSAEFQELGSEYRSQVENYLRILESI